MKQLLLAVMLIVSVGAFAQTTGDVKFAAMKHSFGKIPQNKPVTTEFVFTNNGSKPLIIESATAECGCTSPEFSKAPVMKGKSANIKVTYNAAAEGPFTKRVTVKFANLEPVVLEINGEVQPSGK
ncbi:DUF1573 domain-containing protein [Foetidibacter luteolus]|uniref:DUF1573 domain-containing protein n=1 Tax=Foetidibacter luteolus TaxID=2608880 RepID=UPI00129A7433|nr:DUF1573 domain-containing protein [Foetidibacter luteolus]